MNKGNGDKAPRFANIKQYITLSLWDTKFPACGLNAL